MVSKTLQAKFQRDGFLVLESVFNAVEIGKLRDAAATIVAGFDASSHRSVFRTDDRDAGRDEYFFASAETAACFLEADAIDADGELTRAPELSINKIGHALHDRVPAFGEFCRHPYVRELLSGLGQAQPSVWQTMYIFKQPGIGGQVRWHQDASYLLSPPGAVLGLWVALEDANRENGCLWMQPGQHQSGLREIYTVDWATRAGKLATLDAAPWDDGPAVPIEVPAGSLVAFHNHMPHYSSQNTSERSRHAFTVHTAPADLDWDQRNWLQRSTLAPFLL